MQFDIWLSSLSFCLQNEITLIIFKLSVFFIMKKLKNCSMGIRAILFLIMDPLNLYTVEEEEKKEKEKEKEKESSR